MTEKYTTEKQNNKWCGSCINCANLSFNPYPWIFGTTTERAFWKKIQKYTAYDGLPRHRTKKIKIICADKGSVGLSCDAYFKWNMPIWGEICHTEQKYVPFSDRNRVRFPGKISKAQKHYVSNIWCNAALRIIFPIKPAWWRVQIPRLNLFLRIYG